MCTVPVAKEGYLRFESSSESQKVVGNVIGIRGRPGSTESKLTGIYLNNHWYMCTCCTCNIKFIIIDPL